jgi:aldehyde:ferredoxin oxidoreductase
MTGSAITIFEVEEEMLPYHGYSGKLLYVNLSAGELESREYNLSLAEEYLGGVGLGARLLWDEVGPDVDPRDPENLLVFATGPLCGTLIPNAGRMEAIAKSPLTGVYGCSNAGGFFGRELKYAGWDAVVVSGQASHPVYLAMIEDQPELRDAGELWGLTTSKTEAAIRQAWDDTQIKTATIGPAGENGVHLASLWVASQRAADNCGIGAVMGSKQLKAVAVRGRQPVRVKDPVRLYGIADRLLRRTLEPDRPLAGTTLHRVEYEAICSLGDDTWDTDLGAVLGVKRLCEEQGLDTVSASRTVSFAMDLWQEGVLSAEDTGGLTLHRGDSGAVLELLQMMARREGLGGLLAQGIRQTAKILGQEATESAADAGRVEIGAQGDPDQIGGATAGLGPDQARDREDLAAVLDSVGICRSSGIFVMDDIEWSDIADAMEAATGMEMPVERLRLLGERIYNLQRCYNVSHGLTRADDWLGYILGEEPSPGRVAGGEGSDRELAVEQYYRLRGWDPETGWPTRKKLRELGLEDI